MSTTGRIAPKSTAAVDAAIADGKRVIHVSAHSFTPVLDGEDAHARTSGCCTIRAARMKRRCATRWVAKLNAALPELDVRRNYPYRGNADGLTTALRRRHRADRYVGIEVELNQRLLAEPRDVPEGVRRDLRHRSLVGGQIAQILFFEHEFRRIGHPVDVQLAVEMIELVLEHRREKTFQFEHVLLAAQILIRHAHELRPLDLAAQSRHRQTAFPIAGRFRIDDLDASD